MMFQDWMNDLLATRVVNFGEFVPSSCTFFLQRYNDSMACDVACAACAACAQVDVPDPGGARTCCIVLHRVTVLLFSLVMHPGQFLAVHSQLHVL